MQQVLFFENSQIGEVTHEAGDLVEAHTYAATQSGWQPERMPFVLHLEVQFTHSNILPSNLPASTVGSVPSVEQQ